MSRLCCTMFGDYHRHLILVGLLLTTLELDPAKCWSEVENDTPRTREILVKLYSEKDLSTLRLQSSRFGLEYVEKVSKHVHSFRTSPLKKKDVDAFRQFFSAKIAELQEIKYRSVQTYPRWGTSWYSREERSATLFKRHKQCSPCFGMGIEEAWRYNFTGNGVNIGILDVGVEMDHPDLKQNINTELGYNFVDESSRQDFTPKYDGSYYEAYQLMDHGNNIAGLIAAVKGNNLCSDGVAYNASIVPLVVFKFKYMMMLNDQGFSDRYIARALAHKNQHVHIYSNSYNSAYLFSRPLISIQDSLITGTTEGRQGKGSIFVFSLGDKADGFHDGNMDFFANSIYTITIGSVAKGGHVPDNSIPCSCIIASAHSQGNTLDADNFLTTSHQGTCTKDFKGNSAATGIGAGIIALGLQDMLSWRDVQHLLIYTSSLDGLTPIFDSTSNAAGLKYNPHFGYGMMNATAFALAAETWVPVAPQIATVYTMTSKMRLEPKQESERPRLLVVNVEVKACGKTSKCILHIEHVVAQIHYTTTRPRLLSIQLCSPLKTCSYLLNDAKGTSKMTEILSTKKRVQKSWNFTSVQFWGESPVGNWTLVMMQHDRMRNQSYGDFSIRNLSLCIYGTAQNSWNRNNIYLQNQPRLPEQTDDILHGIIELIESPEEIEDEFFKIVPEEDSDRIIESEDKVGGQPKLRGLLILILPLAFCFAIRALKRFLCQRNNEYRIGHNEEDEHGANE